MTAFDHWQAALDELEATLNLVDRLLADDVAEDVEVPDWHPPRVGPIPAQHLPRARLLLDRQRELVSRTTAAMVGVRQKVDLLDRLTGSSRRTAASVYVDTTA